MAALKHITSPSIASVAAEACALTLDDVQSDADHLRNLLHVTIERVQDLPFTREDGSRNVELDHIHSLLWIARDMADKLVSDFDDARHREIKAEETRNA